MPCTPTPQALACALVPSCLPQGVLPLPLPPLLLPLPLPPLPLVACTSRFCAVGRLCRCCLLLGDLFGSFLTAAQHQQAEASSQQQPGALRRQP